MSLINEFLRLRNIFSLTVFLQKKKKKYTFVDTILWPLKYFSDNGFGAEGVSLFNRIPRPRSSMFECLFSCQRSVKEYFARKKV